MHGLQTLYSPVHWGKSPLSPTADRDRMWPTMRSSLSPLVLCNRFPVKHVRIPTLTGSLCQSTVYVEVQSASCMLYVSILVFSNSFNDCHSVSFRFIISPVKFLWAKLLAVSKRAVLLNAACSSWASEVQDLGLGMGAGSRVRGLTAMWELKPSRVSSSVVVTVWLAQIGRATVSAWLPCPSLRHGTERPCTSTRTH